MEIEKINQTQQPSCLVNNKLFCYKGETHTGDASERKQHFLKHTRNCSNNKEGYVKSLHTYELKEMKKQKNSKTRNCYAREDHDKTTSYDYYLNIKRAGNSGGKKNGK